MLPQLTTPELASRNLSTPTANHDLLQIADIVQFSSFIWRHKLRIALGVLIAVAPAALYCSQADRAYESTARMLLVRKSPLSVEGMPAAVPLHTEAVSTHIALIKSPWLASRVLTDAKVRSLVSFAHQEDHAGLLSRSLSVVHENKDDHVPFSDSNVLQISFRGPRRDECSAILNSVMAVYQRYLEESNRNVNQDALELITKKAEQIRLELGKKEAEYQQFRSSAPLLLSGHGGTSSSHDQLAKIDSSVLALKTRRAEIESRIKAVREAARSPDHGDAVMALLPDSYKPHRPSLLSESFLALLLEERKLSKSYGPDHPKVMAVREQLRLAQQLRSLSSPQRRELVDVAAEYVRSLEQELKDIAAAEESLNEHFKAEGDEARLLADLELKDEQYRNAIARDQQFLDALMTQIKGLDLGMESGGYQTTVIAPPSEPKQVAPRQTLVVVVAVFLGIAIGVLYGLMSDAADRSFRNTNDLAFSLNLPVLAEIPTVHLNGPSRRNGDPRIENFDTALCAQLCPDSPAAEAYRAVRTALHFAVRSEKTRLIEVTSPNVGDGKTTVAANLAISLAQSGKRVLLIDADLHVPRIHALFAVSPEVGLSSVLTGDVALEDAIQPTGIAGLWVLASGPPPTSPADLLTSPRLKESLDTLRDRYDYVLIDTPALLVATDSQIVAASADGVLLVIRYLSNERAAAAQATEILRFSGTKILGVVVNAANGAEPTRISQFADARPAGEALTRRKNDVVIPPK